MTIVKINGENFAEHRDDLIALGDEFLVLVCGKEPRDGVESEEVYRTMLEAAPGTELLVVRDESGAAVGISYYNFGTGYSCGGRYLWLNCVYIREAYQKQGYGSRLVEFIVAEGEREGIKLFVSSRAPENEGSRRLFDRVGFEQAAGIFMEKM